MAMSMTNKNASNRRRAARIYEHVDLFYQTITAPDDFSAASQHQDDVASFEQDKEGHLPKSSSQENETLNVNISSTGISYTCREELNPGDHILLRILLLSSMTVITVSCEVIYCKPSNPFENNRYPFLIGGRFINIREEDTELLEQHIRRKKIQRYPFQALLVLLTLATIQAPDVILELLVGVTEFIAEFAIESAFILFEIVSMYLDHAIEAIFHTKIHDTQMISFYLMWATAAGIVFILSKKTFILIKNLKKASLKYYWHEKSLMYKSGIIGGSLAVCFTYVMFFI
jgi:hypothetical protein